MAAPAQNGPVPAPTNQPTVEQLQLAFDNSIWYLLSLWQPLHVAVSNAWGGPSSEDKRDWMAGAISEQLTENPATDNEDLECMLLQIMQDEFDCNVEDESEVEVARSILLVRQTMLETQSLDAAREVQLRWQNRGQMRVDVSVQEKNQEVGDDEEWNGMEDGEQDDEMDEAPALVQAPAQPRERAAPEVDEDGFTKVASKKKR